MKHHLIVEMRHHGERVDKYIKEQLPEVSRSRIQTLIDLAHVTVNGISCKSNTRLKENDEIEICFPQETTLNVEAENMNLDIRYEDDDVIVINKPKGIVVHPAVGHHSNTLVNGLMYECKDLSGINGVLRPGIVHRIDKDTSGLLIVAKNDFAHQALVEQLQKKTMHRLYYALVHGVITHEFGTIDAPIGRDPKERQNMTVTAVHSKEAKTHFKVLERFHNFSLVECRLETGRTHQIRVHMQYIGHPVAGDPKYSYRKPYVDNGQLLHAHQLSFIQPTTKKEITVHAELPKEFDEILNKLRMEMR